MVSAQFIGPTEAAQRLGVSAKALRLYEQRGLLEPTRTAAGWRTYGPEQMARGGEIVALRALGLSLQQIGKVLGGDVAGLDAALAGHQAMLEGQIPVIAAAVERVRRMRTELAQDRQPKLADILGLAGPGDDLSVAFDLPWPWGGERFEMRGIKPLSFIVGPLGSGKTRLAQRLAEALPGAVFLGLDRAESEATADRALLARVERARDWLVEDGGEDSGALRVLLSAVEADGEGALVVDMVEDGLGQETQVALMAYLRHGRAGARPLLLMTRSTSVLDMAEVKENEAIIFCPANHSPPMLVRPFAGTPGYEALVSCLASPEVRARTAGVVATFPVGVAR